MFCSQEKQAEADKIFDAFDKNKNGLIEKEELFEGLKKLITSIEDPKILEAHITGIWQKADRDLSGGIDKPEFFKIYNDVVLSTTNFDALY